MAGLLKEAGIAADKIILEDKSTDTLSSVRNCARLLRSLAVTGQVIVCSDVYHIPRCRWLFYLYGISSRAGQVVSGRSQNSLWRWTYYYLREIVAFPWDTLLVIISLSPGGKTPP
jgi:uncharacterized SAM-binding protein YcdF (DUF218 family)